MHIVVTGGCGFVGTHLCRALIAKGHKVTVIGPHTPLQNLQDCDAIIHLAGVNIFHRWTRSYKQRVIDSRIKTAHAIYDCLVGQTKKPRVFISASAVGFYGDRGDEVLDEESPPGTGFLADTCIKWEKAKDRFTSIGMRSVAIRTSVVLDRDGGALLQMLPIFRLGLGGKLGSGKQWFPWIHIDDLINIYIQALDDERFIGSINAVAPEAIRNVEFTKALGKVLRRPTIFTIPAIALRSIFGEMSALFLSSQKAVPRALERLGFVFKYKTIEQALKEVVN